MNPLGWSLTGGRFAMTADTSQQRTVYSQRDMSDDSDVSASPRAGATAG